MQHSRYNVWVERANAAYVFNGISGGLLRMSRTDQHRLHAFLQGHPRAECSPRLLEQLVIGRMLVPTGADEIQFLAKRYAAGRYDKSHFNLTLVTSLGCNFACPYCFEPKQPSVMNSDVQSAVLRVLDKHIPNITSFRATWFGGEPLIGKKPLFALSDAFIDRTDRAKILYDAHIATNGYLLTKDVCLRLRDCRVSSAQVCLDGPPEIHDRMRPRANGKGSFWRIVDNLHHAVEYLKVVVRVNLDMRNAQHAEELLKILAQEGFAEKLTVYPGQLVSIGTESAPSASYGNRCFESRQFAIEEQTFSLLAMTYGLSTPSLPSPVSAPCTAVRRNEVVVGSKGELYKCWDSIGTASEVVGHITEYDKPNGRLQKWLKYDPFRESECRSCIALPICMGGCADHAMNPLQYENRCGTFRHTYERQVLEFVKAVEAKPTRGVVSPATAHAPGHGSGSLHAEHSRSG
jgi:uncharacterized protein